MVPFDAAPKLNFENPADLSSPLPVVTGKNIYFWSITAPVTCPTLFQSCLPYLLLQEPHHSLPDFIPHSPNWRRETYHQRWAQWADLRSPYYTQGHLRAQTTAYFHGMGEPPALLGCKRHLDWRGETTCVWTISSRGRRGFESYSHCSLINTHRFFLVLLWGEHFDSPAPWRKRCWVLKSPLSESFRSQ